MAIKLSSVFTTVKNRKNLKVNDGDLKPLYPNFLNNNLAKKVIL